ncbi:MAG: hypothetical protein DCC71_02815 [Proteobacteria bacterium]|nr:MAG: hypothetical protein DCC71_02815 [Pseudomonadota bacterium]
MRVLVTGASGFVGRHLLPRLAEAGHAPVALLLPDEAAPPWIAACGAEVVRGDVTRLAAFGGVAKDCGAVVHLAAAVGYGQRLEHCLRLNRNGTAHVAHAAREAGARRFVHLSSVSVYGRVAERSLDEESPLRKTGDPYGDTKIDAERILAAHAARDELDLTVLRPTVIYGPGDVRFLGKLVENLRGGRAAIIGSGDNRVDAVHVRDVANLVVRALAEPAAVGRVYNVAHPANPTWNELIRSVADALGVPPPSRHLPYPAAFALAAALEARAWLRGGEPRLTRYAVRVVGRRYHYPVTRAERELGFAPQVPLLAGVREVLGAASPAATRG